jgi:hypothetical protein
MDNNLPFHIKMFNDKVRAMNQTNGKVLTLNPQEARNLHAEIYDLMATVAEFSRVSTATSSAAMDGGGFK